MDRLYVCYEKYRRMIAEKKILHRLVQGVRILTVALACYGWWGVIYPELTMLPSTYEIVYEETEATEAETVQTGPEVVEWNSDSGGCYRSGYPASVFKGAEERASAQEEYTDAGYL